MFRTILTDLRRKALWCYESEQWSAVLRALLTDRTGAMILYRLMQWSRRYHLVPLKLLFNKLNAVFVKRHTHGAKEANRQVVLGEPMARFHQDLARRAQADPYFRFHYVTTREMYNLVRAAEAGWQGGVAEARDFELLWNGGQPSAASSASLEFSASSVSSASSAKRPAARSGRPVPLSLSLDRENLKKETSWCE